MFRIFCFVLGLLFCSLGLSFCILYLNLMTMGYTFATFVHFIISRFECNLFIVGIFMIMISWKGKEIYELLLRRFIKF